MNKDNILKFNEKQIIPTIVCLILAIISAILVPYTDSLSIILAGAFALFTLLFLLIYTLNKIKSKIAIKKYGLDNLKRELQANNIVKVKGVNAYLTENYIISNNMIIKITKLSDIDWIYEVSYRRTISPSNNIKILAGGGGTGLEAYLKSGKKIKLITTMKFGWHMPEELIDKIIEKNSKVLVGYNVKNIAKYAQINSKFKVINIINNIIPIIILFLFVLLTLFMMKR